MYRSPMNKLPVALVVRPGAFIIDCSTTDSIKVLAASAVTNQEANTSLRVT